MLVFDTSAYINGQRDHLPPTTFPSVWVLVGTAIEDERIVIPREVYREVGDQDDDIKKWLGQYEGFVVEPSEEVQHLAGTFQAHFGKSKLRNRADPFILAEAQFRSFTVVTYEGRTFSGVPTKNWHRSMPGICKHFGIPCCTLAEALAKLGASI
jgi:hypothetical protein